MKASGRRTKKPVSPVVTLLVIVGAVALIAVLYMTLGRNAGNSNPAEHLSRAELADIRAREKYDRIHGPPPMPARPGASRR